MKSKVTNVIASILLFFGALFSASGAESFPSGHNFYKSIKGRPLFNSAPFKTIAGLPLFNSNGDIDPNTTGFKYVTSTLSYIRKQIIAQKFFEVDIPDYVPLDLGEAAWSDEIIQNSEYYTGGSFFEGDVDQGGSKISRVDTAIVPNRMPVCNWRKKAEWTIFELKQAANASNWDPIEGKIRSLKKNWDLGIQELAFLGRPNDTVMTGLLNNGAVNIDTTTIAVQIASMSDLVFQAFVKAILTAFYDNSNSTALPDTFVMPADDYLGLGSAASATFPNISKFEYLENMFKKMTHNDKFRILPLAYASATNSRGDLSKDRYVLYRNDVETLAMAIPVDFTMLEPRTVDSMDWLQLAYGQYSGVLINRIREVEYFDLTPVTT